MKIHALFAAIVLVGIAGCSQEAPPMPGKAAEAVPEGVTAAPAEQARQQAVGEIKFSMSPESFRVCDGQPRAIASNAKWDVTARQVTEVSIYVTNPRNGERKLWLNGGATGESMTGKWVFPDSKFELVERGSERPLGELTVKALPCN